MKSVKKRFKLQLKKLQTSATFLLWLCQDISILQDAETLLRRLLQTCSTLLNRANEVDKASFASEMREEKEFEALISLMDLDLISLVEQRCFQTLPQQEACESTILQPLLDKVENHYGAMLEDIRELIILLEDDN